MARLGDRDDIAPAQFEQLGGPADRQVRGKAGVIEYDFQSGVVKLTDQVWFSNGKDEFRGDVVIYSVRDERVRRPRDGALLVDPAEAEAGLVAEADGDAQANVRRTFARPSTRRSISSVRV